MEYVKLPQEHQDDEQKGLESENQEVKARKVDEHIGVYEVSHPSEPERMLKQCIGAANGMIETQTRRRVKPKKKWRKSKRGNQGRR